MNPHLSCSSRGDAVSPLTMTSPSMVHIRRHKSLCTTSPSTSKSLRTTATRSPLPSALLKSWRLPHHTNPHVGTFRHAPPLLGRRKSWKTTPHKVTLTTSTTTRSKIADCQQCCRRPKQVESPKSTSKNHHVKDTFALYQIADLLNGRLPGGGVSKHGTTCWGDTEWTGPAKPHTHNKDNNHSSAVQLLARVASWLLVLPFTGSSTKMLTEKDHTAMSSSSLSFSWNHSSHYESENDDDDEESTQVGQGSDDSDNDSYADECTVVQGSSSPARPSVSSSTSPLVDQVNVEELTGSASFLSSQAEAYYAHQATQRMLRLDYDSITQMDVLRMMRNASRHLDVKSIVQLPVYTYPGTPITTTLPPPPEGRQDEHLNGRTSSASSLSSEEPEMSWLLVQPRVKKDSGPPSQISPRDLPTREEDDVCVICLEHFCPGDRLRVLPCHHSFHVGCIDRWLSGSHSFEDCYTSGCPTCKKRPDESLHSDDQEQEEEGESMDVCNGGSVPSWAFTRIGNALARNNA